MEGHAFYYDLTSDRIGMAESYNCQPKSGLTGFVDDDMFALPTIESGSDPWGYDFNDPNGYSPGVYSSGRDVGNNQHGANCTSATCISFVTVGYCIVAVALAVTFKKYRPRDRSKKFEESAFDDVDTVFGSENETLNPEFHHQGLGVNSSGSGSNLI